MWFKELVKSPHHKKLAFLYLSDDVMRNSIKGDCPEFVTEFGIYMKEVFKHLVTVNFDEKTISKIVELIEVWRGRQLFDEGIHCAIEKIWKEGSVVVNEMKKVNKTYC